ncbi:hypothetical protein ScPMuIL_005236 [Solemya velum]
MDSASIVSDTASSPDTDPTYSMRHKRFSEDDADERRLKFLERNRAAAARCRQKRKHWITSLEKKAEELQNTNSRLQGEGNSLRNEVHSCEGLLGSIKIVQSHCSSNQPHVSCAASGVDASVQTAVWKHFLSHFIHSLY